MIMHLVTFTWRPDATEDQVQALVKELGTMPSKIPALRSYNFGPDLGLRDGSADFAVAAVVGDEADLHDYLDHPEHVRIVAAYVKPIVASRNAVDIALPD
jgi:hypothetical protein